MNLHTSEDAPAYPAGDATPSQTPGTNRVRGAQAGYAQTSRQSSAAWAGVIVVLLLGLAAFGYARSSPGAPVVGGKSPNDLRNSYPITSTGTDLTGLGTGPKVGSLAPDFELKDVFTGRPVKLSSLRGKPVWINFWASWCPPCKAELPDMKKAYAKYESRGLVIVGVDLREDPQVVKQFTASNGYNWTFAIDGDGKVTNDYFVFSIPTHIFVGRDGIIDSFQIGSLAPNLMEDHLSKITR